MMQIWAFGDLDYNEMISMNDLKLLQRRIVNAINFSYLQDFLADIDCDGRITVSDVRALKMLMVS